jgi:hypothetical protein
MAGDAAQLPSPQQRIDHIKQMAGEIGTRQREVMHLVVLTFQALYLFFAFTCIAAGIVAEVKGKSGTAVVWGGIGVALAGIWLFVKVLAKSMKKLVRALKQEMARIPDELQQEFGRNTAPGPGSGVRDAATSGFRGPRALRAPNAGRRLHLPHRPHLPHRTA